MHDPVLFLGSYAHALGVSLVSHHVGFELISWLVGRTIGGGTYVQTWWVEMWLDMRMDMCVEICKDTCTYM